MFREFYIMDCVQTVQKISKWGKFRMMKNTDVYVEVSNSDVFWSICYAILYVSS